MRHRALDDGLRHLDREHAVPARGAAQARARRQRCGDPDRDARGLYRAWGECGVGELVELAAVVHGFAAQQRVENGEAFVETAGASLRARVLAEAAELHRGRFAETDAEHRPAAGQSIERVQFLRELPRPAPRERRDHRPEADAAGGLGNRREHHRRVDDVEAPRRFDREVVPDEDCVVSGTFGNAGKLNEAARITVVVEDRGIDGGVHRGAPAWWMPRR